MPRFVLRGDSGTVVEATVQPWTGYAVGDDISDVPCAWIGWLGTRFANVKIDVATGAECDGGSLPAWVVMDDAPYAMTIEY